MSRNKKIRVPRTTAQLVVGLSRILREQMELTIVTHEHWEFERVADWTSGKDHIVEVHPAWEHDCHLVVGDAEIRLNDGKATSKCKIKIRARIQRNEWLELGYPDHFYWNVQIWVLMPSGEIVRGNYNLWNDGGDIIENQDEMPLRPPSKVAFWRAWTDKSDDEIKAEMRRICRVSKSDQQVRDRLRDELGYPYGDAAVTSTSYGPMRMTMVMLHGPRGNTLQI